MIGIVITQLQRAILVRAYRTIKPGRYWYDRVSGLWGEEGKPTFGHIMPGLDLGGACKADVPHENTKVFRNGWELTQAEVKMLQQLGPVNPGRYWVNAQGVGEIEGSSHSLVFQCSSRKGTWSTIARPPAGRIGGDENCHYWFDPMTGSSVMNGN